ncbi:MAG: hypothetical protein JWP13_22, partial [Candidatus Saccharibacteria bacterium]|nr:hypothetical protein [Candidatus Saccharibacteria bacterium]
MVEVIAWNDLNNRIKHAVHDRHR